MNHGLMTGFQCIMAELKKQKECKPLLVLISDGRVNVSINKDLNPMDEANQIALQIKKKQIDSLIIDTENGFVRLGKLQAIADVMGAKYLKIEDLKSESIVRAIG